MNSSIIELNVMIAECLEAERDLAKFLEYCAKKYGLLLSDDEAAQGVKLMQRVSVMVDRVNSALNRPPDKLPVYPIGGPRVRSRQTNMEKPADSRDEACETVPELRGDRCGYSPLWRRRDLANQHLHNKASNDRNTCLRPSLRVY
jgi:hypothetical protein